jgi:dihydroorotase
MRIAFDARPITRYGAAQQYEADIMSLDLVLHGGRVVDPSQGIDAVMDVGFRDGRVAQVGPGLGGDMVRDVPGLIVTPGLIDLHTHVYWGGTSLGVDPLTLARGGCTTLVDTGSAGPGNYAGFLEHVIRPSPVRIISLLNVSFAGIYGFSKRVMVGESGDLRLMAPIDAVEVASANRDTVAGIKVRVGFNASQNSGMAPLDIALKVAEEAGLPVMAHIDVPPPTLEDVLARLRPGDILTHCFRPFPNSPTTPDGGVRSAVSEARKKGVIFDIGHGMGSFAFKTARTMLANGFAPDCISSDVHALCIDGPAFDLLTTMSKFLCLGLPLTDVVRAATDAPAKALRRSDLGTLRPGATGDASVLELESGKFDYVDSTGERLAGQMRLRTRAVIMNGHWWKG